MFSIPVLLVRVADCRVRSCLHSTVFSNFKKAFKTNDEKSMLFSCGAPRMFFRRTLYFLGLNNFEFVKGYHCFISEISF